MWPTIKIGLGANHLIMLSSIKDKPKKMLIPCQPSVKDAAVDVAMFLLDVARLDLTSASTQDVHSGRSRTS